MRVHAGDGHQAVDEANDNRRSYGLDQPYDNVPRRKARGGDADREGEVQRGEHPGKPTGEQEERCQEKEGGSECLRRVCWGGDIFEHLCLGEKTYSAGRRRG